MITGSTDLGNGVVAVTVSHDPTTVATNVPTGSLIITSGGVWYHKNDDGSTTNVTAAIGAYSPSTPSNWSGSAPSTVQSALDRLAAAVFTLRGSAIP